MIILKILLVRHGNWQRGSLDPPLSEEGECQVRQLVKSLDSDNIEIIYSSPRRRTKKTAKIINKQIGCKTIYLDGLRDADFDHVDFSVIQNALSQGQKLTTLWLKGLLPGAEPISQFLERVHSALKQIYEKHKESCGFILVVTHMENIWAILSKTQKRNFLEVAQHQIPYACPIIIEV